MRIYNHSLIQRAIADLRIHQNGLDATLSIKRNRTTIYLNIYSPAGLTFDIKKVKPIFLLFGKSCIFENREYIEIKKNRNFAENPWHFRLYICLLKTDKVLEKKSKKNIAVHGKNKKVSVI